MPWKKRMGRTFPSAPEPGPGLRLDALPHHPSDRFGRRVGIEQPFAPLRRERQVQVAGWRRRFDVGEHFRDEAAAFCGVVPLESVEQRTVGRRSMKLFEQVANRSSARFDGLGQRFEV